MADDDVVVPFDTLTFDGNGKVTIETAVTGDQLSDLRPFDPAEFGIRTQPDEESGAAGSN